MLYLVGLPVRQSIKDAGNSVIAETLNIYDANTLYTQTPTSGILKKVRIWVKGAQTSGDYSQVDYGYDTWGNQTTVTTYSGYGHADTTPTTGAQTSYTCYGSGEALNGDACADDVYRTYPLWSKNALGQRTTITYDYRLGLPLTESDPNDPTPSSTTETGNTTIEAQYDAFGRMTKLIRPGNDSINPTLKMEYSNSYPFTTSVTQRVDSNNTYTITRFYDGMGRLTTSVGYPGVPVPFTVMAGPYYVYTDTEYVSATMTKQSMPHTSTETVRYTTTTIDINARTVTVEAPDGTSTRTATDGLVTTARDALGNVTTSGMYDK
jgi:hypothetical protein